jgi:phosphatidylinositol dimannoside acyltransferase
VTSRKGFEAPHRRLESTPPRIVEKAAVIGYRSMSALLAHTPPGIWQAVIGGANQLAYLAWPAKRHFINVNMAHVLGLPPDHPRVRRLALRAYREYARYMVELMRLPSRPMAELAQGMDGNGIDPMLDAFVASGKSLIVVCGHIGNNEAVAAAIASRGLPANVVADDSSFPEIFEILRQQRESWGVHVVPWRNIRELFTILRRSEMLALLVDWGYRADGIPVQLFGAWTTLPAGPAVLSAKTGALISFMAVRRQPGGKFRVETTEPFTVASSRPAEIQAATQRIAGHLEAALRAAPVQWYSFKQLWPDDPAEAEELAARAAIMQSGRPDPGPTRVSAPGEGGAS